MGEVKDNLHSVLLHFAAAVLVYLHNVILTIETCKNTYFLFTLETYNYAEVHVFGITASDPF